MITDDQVFDAMADVQRRRLLVRLVHDEPQPVPQLSSVACEILRADEGLLEEYLSGSSEIADADKADIRIHHVHLPKLAEYSYIEWDRDAHVTTQGPKFDDMRPLLEAVDETRKERHADDVPMIIEK